MNKLKHNMFLKKFLLFLVGYCLYIAIEITFRGYSYPLMGIVGGIALILLDELNDRIIGWDVLLITQMVMGGFFITVLELISGKFALYVLHVRMWDYRGQWMASYDGLICPLFSVVWIGISLIGILLGDAINYYVLHSEIQPYYRHLSGKLWFKLPRRTCGA